MRDELVHPVMGRHGWEEMELLREQVAFPPNSEAIGLSFPFGRGVSIEVSGLELKRGCLLG